MQEKTSSDRTRRRRRPSRRGAIQRTLRESDVVLRKSGQITAMDVFRQMIEIRSQLLCTVGRAGHLGMTAAGNFAGGDWANSFVRPRACQTALPLSAELRKIAVLRPPGKPCASTNTYALNFATLVPVNGLQRFHSCYIPKPLLQSGIFLKKMPPSIALAGAHKLWNRSSVG